MKPTLALSTCWLSHRHQDGYEMIREMAGLGFRHVELSHGIRITLVPGILRALQEGLVQVSSCHNFCPLPTGITHAAPNLYEPTDPDARQRAQWLRHSKRSVEFARQVGATRLVVHLGHVEFFWFHPARKIERHREQHPAAEPATDPDYQRLLTRALARMRARQVPFWDRLRASVAELLPVATAQGVALGFENREQFDELPLDEDHAGFIAALPPDALGGYWHDTGHAQLKEAMGLLRHREHLEKNAPRALGFHLHDVSADGHDHQEIGSGQIDFEMVSRFWRPEHALVIELSPRLKPEEVLRSKERIEALITARFGA